MLGLVVGAYVGNRLGAVRDAKGKCVAAVFAKLGGGTFMLDGWARQGLMGCDFFTPRLRPGKPIVDGIIALTTNNQLTNISSWISHQP